MTWTLYTTLTARNRAIEALVAILMAIWAGVVLSYALRGLQPLAWAGIGPDAQWRYIATAVLSCVLHMAGTQLAGPAPLPAIMRAVGMAGMACSDLWHGDAGLCRGRSQCAARCPLCARGDP